jgi:tetratricopeptide (TPR) repeat protein
MKLLSAGRYEEAVATFIRVKQLAPRDPRVYFLSAMALAQAGRLGVSAEELQEAVRLVPDRAEYQVWQANVYLRLKQKNRATDVLDKLEKMGSAEQLPPALLKILADDYYRLARVDDALRILALLARHTPDDPDIELNRGQVYVVLGRFDLAEESFRRSLEKSHRNPIAHFELGSILYARNELASARESLLTAVDQDGRNPKYLQKLGDACLALGEVDRAIEFLKRAEASGPRFPEIYYSLGRAYQKKGEREPAEVYLKKFQEAKLSLRDQEAHDREVEKLIVEGEAEFDQGHAAQARASFERAAQLDPDNWDARGYLAEMFLASGDLDRAYPHLMKMEEIDPESVVGNYLMAKYWFAREEYGRARPYAEKARSSRPGNSELRGLAGDIYRNLGQKEKALEEFQAAVRLAPDRADFREHLRQLQGDASARTQ